MKEQAGWQEQTLKCIREYGRLTTWKAILIISLIWIGFLDFVAGVWLVYHSASIHTIFHISLCVCCV